MRLKFRALTYDKRVEWLDVSFVESGKMIEWKHEEIAVVTVEPADKIYFGYNCMPTRLRGQYNGNWPISLVYMS